MMRTSPNKRGAGNGVAVLAFRVGRFGRAVPDPGRSHMMRAVVPMTAHTE
jgi:hypothetical protein